MSRAVPLLCLGCAVLIGASTYSMLGSGEADRIAVPDGPAAVVPPVQAAAAALQTARRTCTLPAIDAIVLDLRATCASPTADGNTWHLLAEALLERVQLRSHRRGLTVGAPVYSELPGELAADIDAGLAAVARARELGHDAADLYRIEAGLMSQRITGLGTALQWNTRIKAALAKAAALAQDDPRLHVALGLQKLLAPKLLGHDPVAALQHFEFAAGSLVLDERPAVFAGMASYLQKKRQQAIEWLEKAVTRNPENVFARVVLRRLRRDEPDPFGRDVTDEEAAAAK